MKSCLSTGQVQIKDWCFPNGFILTQALTHTGKHTHTHTQRNETGSQSQSGQQKIKLWFQFVFLSIHCWITDTPNASLYVSDLRKHSQSVDGFFPDLKKKNRMKPVHLQYSCAHEKCVKRDKQTHPSSQKIYQRRKAKKWFKNSNSSIKDKNVQH